MFVCRYVLTQEKAMELRKVGNRSVLILQWWLQTKQHVGAERLKDKFDSFWVRGCQLSGRSFICGPGHVCSKRVKSVFTWVLMWFDLRTHLGAFRLSTDHWCPDHSGQAWTGLMYAPAEVGSFQSARYLLDRSPQIQLVSVISRQLLKRRLKYQFGDWPIDRCVSDLDTTVASYLPQTLSAARPSAGRHPHLLQQKENGGVVGLQRKYRNYGGGHLCPDHIYTTHVCFSPPWRNLSRAYPLCPVSEENETRVYLGMIIRW